MNAAIILCDAENISDANFPPEIQSQNNFEEVSSSIQSKRSQLFNQNQKINVFDHSSIYNEEINIQLTQTLDNKEFMKTTQNKSKQMNLTSTEGMLKSSLEETRMDLNMNLEDKQ